MVIHTATYQTMHGGRVCDDDVNVKINESYALFNTLHCLLYLCKIIASICDTSVAQWSERTTTSGSNPTVSC